MKRMLCKIFGCSTEKRFQRVFEKFEKEGYEIFARGQNIPVPERHRRIRNYTKNLFKVIYLYDKFNAK